ncbi:hypothetical protein [Methylobacterium sp. Leaf466]|uniref:hypothetical protein n=1 Tax=Methylobacterium sp. Leaf466 TaxID=1736386 RepID=UPI0006FD8F71|nr:hypothetical protein [Methylobacterium sp. Leaf466]KQT77850.1 hypothetical protein ASG59_11010 [Methylobacterium sp. Leaf466]
MRDRLMFASAVLVAGGLAVAPAVAQTGWVDPPTKVQGQPAAEAPTPVAPPAPQPSAEPRAAARTAEPSPAAVTESPARPRREARRPVRPGQDRLVFTPPAAAAAPGPGVDDPRFPAWAGKAQRLTLDYLDSVSASNEASLAEAPRFYAPQVRRFGRTVSLTAVIADKRRFASRWPERRYAAQPGAIRTSCNAAMKVCIVQATYDYSARNPARGTRTQGVGELVLEISFADDRPVIVSESGRVLRRAASASLVDARTKAGA